MRQVAIYNPVTAGRHEGIVPFMNNWPHLSEVVEVHNFLTGETVEGFVVVAKTALGYTIERARQLSMEL